MLCQRDIYDHYPGVIIPYGDTDSVLLYYNKLNVQGLSIMDTNLVYWEYYETMGKDMTTRLFPDPHLLELEDINLYMQFFKGNGENLGKKKAYIKTTWTAKDGYNLKLSGLSGLKRVNPPWVRQSIMPIVRVLVDLTKDDTDLLTIIRERCQLLLDRDSSLTPNHLSISNQIQELSEYKSTNLVQLKVAETLRKKCGVDVKAGQRVRYFISNRGKLMVTKGCPTQLFDWSKLDFRYYFMNFMKKSLGQFLQDMPLWTAVVTMLEDFTRKAHSKSSRNAMARMFKLAIKK